MNSIKKIEIVCQKGNDDVFSMPKHVHSGYQLIYVRKGKVFMEVGGSAYELGGHSLVFISNLEQHSIREVVGEYDRIYVNLAPDYTESVLQSRQLLSVFCNRPNGFSHVISVADNAFMIDMLFKGLIDEYQQMPDYWEEMCGLFLKRLLILLYRDAPQHFPTESNNIRNLIWDVKAYIDDNFARPLTIRETAEHFHVSNFYLSHAFKQVTGYSPKQYLMQCRLTAARRLLLTTDEKVGVIAMQTGFGDASNFTRSFRESAGMTPQEYRNRGVHTSGGHL